MKWKIFKELNVPCADISYQWISEENSRLIIIMHFSRVVEGFEKDLELIFFNPIALQWEDECYPIFDLPEKLPKCTKKGFEDWTYPTLIIPNSQWADRYDKSFAINERHDNQQLKHFVLISMNDILSILSCEMPNVKLIDSQDI
ncbi:hypothetical protein [Halarcobacter sp.]|uniref:hypothetical protein n=1 Tax=Halarcobacter sp. TaxID=2321133 RepID=UPI002AA6B7DE|nr:hypothetical protein [Halarcobacter sp.]